MKSVIKFEKALGTYSKSKRAIVEHALGYCYENGTGGVSQDLKLAFKHYQKAFELSPERPDNACSLARCYRRGIGVTRDLEKANYYVCIENALLFGRSMPKKQQWQQ